jgi:DNA-binding response OmpR family regulator
MKLLVVDDQGPVGEIISRIAQQSGWEAIHTVSSERLDEIVRAEDVDVLLIDYVMDGNPRSTRNGLTVATMLRERGIQIPIIMFSGWTDLIDRKLTKKLGIQCVLEKPLGIQELRKALVDAKKDVVATSPSKTA